MKKILLLIWMTMFPFVCGAEEMTFVTVIGAPWGVVNSVGGMGDTSSVNILNFVTVPNFSGTGAIQLTQKGDDGRPVEAQLSKVYLAQNAGLSVPAVEDSGVNTWNVINGSVAIKPNGTIEVDQLGSAAAAANLNFMNDADNNSRSFLKVTPHPEGATGGDGELTFSDDVTVAALSTKKVTVDSNDWYNSTSGTSAATAWWKYDKETQQALGKHGRKVGMKGDKLKNGDYILVGIPQAEGCQQSTEAIRAGCVASAWVTIEGDPVNGYFVSKSVDGYYEAPPNWQYEESNSEFTCTGPSPSCCHVICVYDDEENYLGL